jgi:hypothetical protein
MKSIIRTHSWYTPDKMVKLIHRSLQNPCTPTCFYNHTFAPHNLKWLELQHKTKSFYFPNRYRCVVDTLNYYYEPCYTAAKYSLLSLGSGFMDFSPGFHPAGQTSSGFSCTYCKACKSNAYIWCQTYYLRIEELNEKKKQIYLKVVNLDVVQIRHIIYLECSLCLINTSTNSKVVDGRMLDNPFLVNNEQPSQSYPLNHWKYLQSL